MKINYKLSATQKESSSINPANNNVDETKRKIIIKGAPSDKNQPCNCEFCKLVIRQVKARKNRANEKKNCKNSSVPLNPNESEPCQLDEDEKEEICVENNLLTHSQRFDQLMALNQREREKRQLQNLNNVNPSQKEIRPGFKAFISDARNQAGPIAILLLSSKL